MKSNYKRIGDFIRPIKVKNIDSSDKSLLGININKYFMPSVANVVGTDLSKYKIVKKGQFSCNRMHVGRDKRLPVALSNQEDNFIVSPAYDVFEIFDKDILLPEYLMMWFSRKEFDRNAWFYTDADVRGGLHWDAFCNMQLPVPDIEKQKSIVKEYNTIVNRIKLNEQLNQKLEETAQAIYKQWFVDFEFPMAKEYAESIGKPELEGKAYKANGGKMVWNEELGEEIPVGWECSQLINFGKVITGKTPSSNNPEHFGRDMLFVTPTDYKNYGKFVLGADRSLSNKGVETLGNKVMQGGSLLITCIGSDMGKVVITNESCITNQQINSIYPKADFLSDYLYYYLKSIYADLRNMAIGSSTMLMINKTEFELISALKPIDSILKRFHQLIKPINAIIWQKLNSSNLLFQVKNLLLRGLSIKDMGKAS